MKARVALPAVAAYAALLLLTGLFPTAFPRIILPVAPALVHALDGSVRIDRSGIDATGITFSVTSSKLSMFTTMQGSPAPAYGFRCTHHARLINIYPCIAFSILVAWPMILRRKLAALATCAVCLVAFVALDVATVTVWAAAEYFSVAWQQVHESIAATPGNVDSMDAVRRQFDRLTLLKSFFSTGGRQFLAVLAAGLGALAAGPSRTRSPSPV